MRKTVTYGFIALACIMGVVGWFKCKNSNTNAPIADTTIVGQQTTYKPKDTSTVHINVPNEVITKVIKVPVYIKPSTNYDSLLAQYIVLAKEYEGLLTSYHTERVYRDTARQDSSYVVLHSYVTGNRLTANDIDFHLYERHTTEYLSINKPVRQVYINYGGGVTNGLAIAATLGLSYKDRHDRIYTANIEANTLQQYSLMLIRSGKISFRRR